MENDARPVTLIAGSLQGLARLHYTSPQQHMALLQHPCLVQLCGEFVQRVELPRHKDD